MPHQTIEEELAEYEKKYDEGDVQRKISLFEDIFNRERNLRNLHEDKMYEARKKLKFWERIMYDREVKRARKFKGEG